MRQITLRSLSLAGFKSFKRESEIELDPTGFIFVAGDNKVEPRLGANGAGKSTIFDALCFCLYGYGVRGQRVGDLLATGEKALAVTAVLDIDGEEYTISRSGPPARISINSRAREQSEVDHLLGMTRARWLNSIVFGQDVPLFIDRSVPERGELLDEILDLQVWMQAADAASKEHAVATKAHTTAQVQVARVEGEIAGMESIEDLESRVSEWNTEKERRVLEAREKYNKWNYDRDDRVGAMIDQFERHELDYQAALAARVHVVPDVDALWKDYKAKEAAQKEIELERARLETTQGAASDAISFFRGAGDTCPVCTQVITKEFSDQHLSELREKHKQGIEAQGKLDRRWADARSDSNDAHAAWHAANQTAGSAREKNAARDANLRAAKQTIDNMERQIEAAGTEPNPHEGVAEQVEAEVNPHTARLAAIVEARRGAEERLAASQAAEKTALDRMSALDFWRQGFRRVRLFYIRRVLAQLEVETMNASGQLGLVGWKIRFTTETETKSGSTKTGVQIPVESPTMTGPFTNWSGGEGQRVRLCVALGVGSMIQRWSGVRWNLEVFDEPTAWLSEAGIEDLLQLLKTRADLSNKAVYLADHRALGFAGFSKVITVVKDEAGSRIQ